MLQAQKVAINKTKDSTKKQLRCTYQALKNSKSFLIVKQLWDYVIK